MNMYGCTCEHRDVQHSNAGFELLSTAVYALKYNGGPTIQ